MGVLNQTHYKYHTYYNGFCEYEGSGKGSIRGLNNLIMIRL